MEGLHCLKFLLEENDFLCKIDLKDAYFVIPLIKMCKIQVVRQSLRVSLLCFGLGPAPNVFTNLLKSQLLF